jgi:hypothetical protein
MILGIIASGQISISSSGGGGGSNFNLANFPGAYAVYESPYLDGTNRLSLGTTSSSWRTISSPAKTMTFSGSVSQVLTQENTTNTPFGLPSGGNATSTYGLLSGTSDNVFTSTVYIAYDFREAGSKTPPSIKIDNSSSKTNLSLIVLQDSGSQHRAKINLGGVDRTDITSAANKRSGVVAAVINYNIPAGAASYTMYFNSQTSSFTATNYPLPFITSDSPGPTLQIFRPALYTGDWVGVHAVVISSSAHSSATISSNISYLSSRYGVG